MRELFPSENLSKVSFEREKKNQEKSNPYSTDAQKIWGFIQQDLRLLLGEEIFQKWIIPIKADALNEDELTLITPSIQIYQTILNEYLEIIEKSKNKLGFEHVSTVIDLDKNPLDHPDTHKEKSDKNKKKNSLYSTPNKKDTPANDSERDFIASNQKPGLSEESLSFYKSTQDAYFSELPSSSAHKKDSPQKESSYVKMFNICTHEPPSLEVGNSPQQLQESDIIALGKIDSIKTESSEINLNKNNSDQFFSQTLLRKIKLNPKYTFENFVRGPSNQFALAACYNVAENPGKTYNPLFIYGATGLGKTHLIQAVGNHLVKVNANSTVAYVSSERFMNELIYCLRHNKIIDFRQKYRHCDLFLMDDIQFISGNKAATQEEFFHTFNTLYEAKKQIIITSDLFPKDIPDIEERLRNRFQWGLIADIQPPDIEHRIAILYSKAEKLGLDLSLDVAEYIANHVKRNIRELEGALHRLKAFSYLHGRKLDKNLAIETFGNMLSTESPKPQMLIDAVQKTVADHFQIKISELKSKKRHKALTLPRQIAMYLVRKFTKTSYPEIGEKFGGKDHTTVMHAVKKITHERKKNMDLIVHLDALERIIERLN